MFCYVKEEIDFDNYWTIGNYLGNIDKYKEYEKDTLQEKLRDIFKDNNLPMKEFYLDDNYEYTKEKFTNTQENKNLKLTINNKIQTQIKDILNKEEYSNLENISVVMMESKTGKIRSMVQKDEQKENLSIAAEGIGYEPGSVFKLITLAVALEKGEVTMNDVFTCEGKICTHIHGDLTVEDA